MININNTFPNRIHHDSDENVKFYLFYKSNTYKGNLSIKYPRNLWAYNILEQGLRVSAFIWQNIFVLFKRVSDFIFPTP